MITKPLLKLAHDLLVPVPKTLPVLLYPLVLLMLVFIGIAGAEALAALTAWMLLVELGYAEYVASVFIMVIFISQAAILLWYVSRLTQKVKDKLTAEKLYNTSMAAVAAFLKGFRKESELP